MSDDLLAGMVQVHRRIMSEQSNDGALLLKVPDAARLLNISRDHCYELVARGEIPHIRLGRAIRVPRVGLEQWIARQADMSEPVPAAVVSMPSQRH